MSERILNWLIFAGCVFITIICFINTGILWPVVADTQDVIEMNTGYLDFVKIMNLIFGFIFLILSVIFLIRALSTYDGKFGWAKKLRDKYLDKFNNIIKSRNALLEDKLKNINTLLKEENAKPEIEIIPSNYDKGKLITCPLSSSDDKAPVIASNKTIPETIINLGTFKFKGTDTSTTIPTTISAAGTKSPPKPLDSLKAYYVSQNLNRRNR